VGVGHRTADRLVAAARADLVMGWDVQRHEGRPGYFLRGWSWDR
jgi:hypothetical protein